MLRCIAYFDLTPASTAICRVHPLNYQQNRGTRRTTTPARWLPKKLESYKHENLTFENAKLIKEAAVPRICSPLKEEPLEKGEWTENSRRTGLIGRKIGIVPQWLKNGQRILTTMIEIVDNHVINYVDPDVWYKTSVAGKKRTYNRLGTCGKMTIGAVNADPRWMTIEYRRLFESKGISVKQYIGSFAVSENARLQIGTQLFASHFQVGQYVDCTGRTIDWGFQGAMHRWGFRGQQQLKTTKSHRRVGSIGSTGDAKVWPGKRMPGHMGYEWRPTRGVQIMRINNRDQVIYVRGPGIPGDNGEFIMINDCYIEKKRIHNPPFPTFFPDEKMESIPDEHFHESLFSFTNTTIEFEEIEEKNIRDKSVKKQAKTKK